MCFVVTTVVKLHKVVPNVIVARHVTILNLTAFSFNFGMKKAGVNDDNYRCVFCNLGTSLARLGLKKTQKNPFKSWENRVDFPEATPFSTEWCIPAGQLIFLFFVFLPST